MCTRRLLGTLVLGGLVALAGNTRAVHTFSAPGATGTSAPQNVQQSDLTFLGSFGLPGDHDWSGLGLVLSPTGDSFYLATVTGETVELTIPPIGGTATIRQTTSNVFAGLTGEAGVGTSSNTMTPVPVTPGPQSSGPPASALLSGAAYDSATKRFYRLQQGAATDPNRETRVYVSQFNEGDAPTPLPPPPQPPPPPDMVAPTVSVTAPTAGAVVLGTVTVTAAASDNVGVSGVWFTLDNVNFGGEVTTAPYQVTWSTTGATTGPHTFRAMARDAAGNAAASAPLTVSVNGAAEPPPVTAAPATVTTSPAQCTFTLTATPPSSGDGWTVQFRNNLTNAGSADSKAPYSRTFVVGSGVYSYTAHWTKPRRAAVDSGPAAVTCATGPTTGTASGAAGPVSSGAAPPTIAASPAQCAVALAASPPNSSGGWTLQFRSDSVNVGSPDSTSPYSRTITVALGKHSYQARWTKSGQAMVESPATTATCQ